MSAIEDGTASMILHPVRLKIIRLMMKAGAPVYIDQVARELKLDSQLVAFHMEKMEDSGLVTSSLGIVQKEGSKRGWAGRFFEPTARLREAFVQLANVATELRESFDGI
jgi:predicted ArsR family transcriptional regulator